MTSRFALHCAGRLLDWLGPACDRIAVAGSVRRERKTVNDIDVVAVPQMHTERDLLGEPVRRVNVLWQVIAQRVMAQGWELLRGGNDADALCSFRARGVQVDVWTATAETWGTVLLCRTGSKEHNIWLAQRALRLGGRWQPHEGVTLGWVQHAADTEEAIYGALALPFIPPPERESDLLRRFE